MHRSGVGAGASESEEEKTPVQMPHWKCVSMPEARSVIGEWVKRVESEGKGSDET